MSSMSLGKIFSNIVEHWAILLRDEVEYPTLDVFRTLLDKDKVDLNYQHWQEIQEGFNDLRKSVNHHFYTSTDSLNAQTCCAREIKFEIDRLIITHTGKDDISPDITKNIVYIPMKISYDTDGLVCIRNPSDGSLNYHLSECENMISWVRTIYEVLKYTCLICKIWSFAERWITCSENKMHMKTKTLFLFCLLTLAFRSFL